MALQPDLFEGQLARALIHAKVKHDNASALADYESLLKRSPNDPALTEFMAVAKGQAGDWQAALTGMLRACELDPRNSVYIRSLASLYEHLKRYSEADQTYEKALALASDDWFSRGNRVNNLILQGNSPTLGKRSTYGPMPS